MKKEIKKAKQDYKKMKDYTIVEGHRLGHFQVVRMDITNEYAFLNVRTKKLSKNRYFSINVYDTFAECVDLEGNISRLFVNGNRLSPEVESESLVAKTSKRLTKNTKANIEA